MAEVKAEKAKCWNCGADVRPDTQFCYSCGRSVIEPEPPPIEKPHDEGLKALEAALAASRTEESSKTKLESAAAERRKARVSYRKPLEIVWEPAGPGVAYYIAAAVIFLFVLLIVFLSRSAR